VLPYMVLTVLVGILYIAIQRRTAYMSRRQWRQLDHPDAMAADLPSPEPPTTTVTRIQPPAIEARRQ
jgi:hypothetical protein